MPDLIAARDYFNGPVMVRADAVSALIDELISLRHKLREVEIAVSQLQLDIRHSSEAPAASEKEEVLPHTPGNL